VELLFKKGLTGAMSASVMKAVVYDGPHKVSIQDRLIPVIKDQTDIIVKVTYTALCGSYVFGEIIYIFYLLY
jgi:hypothetical protein